MNRLKQLWVDFWSPTTRFSFGTITVAGFIFGILFWGGFNWAIELSNTETFCITCHEMRVNVYEEYKETIHYNNRSGVRAICSDCHVPKPYGAKLWRKIKATNELFYHLMGKIDTPEKFEEHRLDLAQRVWDTMRENDSQECRNCHDIAYMDYKVQAPRARTQHEDAEKEGDTCIDCHKGVAHKKAEEEIQEPEEDEELDFSL